MATKAQLIDALTRADMAGDNESAAALGAMIRDGEYDDADKTSGGAAALQGLGQGATFNYADEAGAGVRAVFEPTLAAAAHAFGKDAAKTPFPLLSVFKNFKGKKKAFDEYKENFFAESLGERYANKLTDQRGALADAWEDHPGIALGSSIVGGLPQGGKTVAKGLWEGAKTGAKFGAAYGAGASNALDVNPESGQVEFSPGQLATDTAFGAGLGGVMGPAIPLLGRGAKATAKAVMGKTARGKEAISKEMARTGVLRDLTDDMQASGMSMDDIAAQLKANPNLVLADMGENVASQARLLQGAPGAAAREMKDFFESRAVGEYDRIMPEMAEALGAQGKNYVKVMDDLMTSARSSAQKLYGEAEQVPIKLTGDMKRLLMTPAGKAAIKEAKNFAAEDGRALDVFSDVAGTGAKLGDRIRGRDVLDLPSTDALIRAWDDRVNTYFRAGKGNKGTNAKKMRNAFRELVYKQNPKYKEARKVWSSDMKDKEALELGRDIFKTDIHELKKLRSNMSETEKTNLRIGAYKAMEKLLGGKKDTSSMADKLVSFRNKRDAIKVAFNDKQAYSKIEKVLKDELKMHATFARTRGGSDTVPKMMKAFQQSQSRKGSIVGLLMGAKVGLPPFLAGSIGAQIGRSSAGKATPLYRQADAAASNILRSNSMQGLAAPTGLAGAVLKPGMNPQVAGQSAKVMGMLAGTGNNPVTQPLHSGLDPVTRGLLQ